MFGELTMPPGPALEADPVSLIVAVIDESGSMSNVRTDTIGGYNTFVGKIQDEQAGKKAYISTFLFDDNHMRKRVRALQEAAPLAQATPLSLANYSPLGGTPLYDAIGHAIASADATVTRLGVNRVTMLIQTDGAENASKEFKHASIKALIDDRTRSGWQFIFLGADLDNARDVGVGLGIQLSNSMAYAKSKTVETFGVMAASTVAYRTSTHSASDVKLTAEQKRDISA